MKWFFGREKAGLVKEMENFAKGCGPGKKSGQTG